MRLIQLNNVMLCIYTKYKYGPFSLIFDRFFSKPITLGTVQWISRIIYKQNLITQTYDLLKRIVYTVEKQTVSVKTS